MRVAWLVVCFFHWLLSSVNWLIDWPSEYWLVGWLYFGRVISGLQWVAGWLVNRLIDWAIVCLLGLLVVWLHCVSIDWLTNWLVNRWIDWLIDWFDCLSKWTRVSEWMSEWLLNPILNNDPVPFKDTDKMRGIYFCIVSLLPESTQISPFAKNESGYKQGY